MLPKEISQIIPGTGDASEVLEIYEVSREFYREVEYREEFERYCQWYYETADRHQQELKKMRGDINIFGWFSRK
ncbi:MAG: hypothetical protein F6J93_16180 [Oscillatoria sp. SIO1A7]|nr:hypothetical protein [Oscillatoria sp. SIO1A7]